MAAIEALQLDVAYVAVAKSLGPADASRTWRSRTRKILDAQAGAETFGERAARGAGRRQLGVRARDARLPARLQPAQARLRRRAVRPGAPLRARHRRRSTTCRPATLIDQLMADQHLIMADHTMAHWPSELYLPSPIDRPRQPRELDQGGRQGHVPARLRRGRSPAGGLPAGRDRPARRRRAAGHHPRRASSTRPSCPSCRRRPPRRRRSMADRSAGATSDASAQADPRGPRCCRLRRVEAR